MSPLLIQPQFPVTMMDFFRKSEGVWFTQRSRPVSRQHIQKLANEMIADGVVELVNNPAHQRSKLLQLTPKGETIWQEITARIAQAAAGLSQDMDTADLQVALRVLRQLSAKLRQTL